MMLRCPVCKAENTQPPNCRRCKADLSLLFALEARRDFLLAQARQEIASGNWHEARKSAEEVDSLRRDESSLRLVALTALLCRDFHAAWRGYALQSQAEGQARESRPV